MVLEWTLSKMLAYSKIDLSLLQRQSASQEKHGSMVLFLFCCMETLWDHWEVMKDMFLLQGAFLGGGGRTQFVCCLFFCCCFFIGGGGGPHLVSIDGVAENPSQRAKTQIFHNDKLELHEAHVPRTNITVR